jgi:hypothetical protein
MITIFCVFWQISAKKLAFFSKTKVMINFLYNLALFWVKNADIFCKLFRLKYFKNHNIGPWSPWFHVSSLAPTIGGTTTRPDGELRRRQPEPPSHRVPGIAFLLICSHVQGPMFKILNCFLSKNWALFVCCARNTNKSFRGKIGSWSGFPRCMPFAENIDRSNNFSSLYERTRKLWLWQGWLDWANFRLLGDCLLWVALL